MIVCFCRDIRSETRSPFTLINLRSGIGESLGTVAGGSWHHTCGNLDGLHLIRVARRSLESATRARPAQVFANTSLSKDGTLCLSGLKLLGIHPTTQRFAPFLAGKQGKRTRVQERSKENSRYFFQIHAYSSRA